SRCEIDAARTLAQDFAEAPYRIVTGIVAEVVVEILETVDIDHQERERTFKPPNASNFPFELTLKPAPVCQARQMVRKRSLLANVEISLELEQRSGPGQQQIDISRICDVTQGADFAGPAKILSTPARGSLHNDRNKLSHGIGSDSLGQLVAIHARHHDVGYHQVRLIRLNRSERLNTV